MNNEVISKILIVDDQPRNIQVLGSLLRDNGFIVGVATNGTQAIELLNNNNDFDLVLLDVNMPDLSGFEVCRIIKATPAISDIPVIFLTAMVETEDIITGFDAGGQDYVTKPFNSKELLARVYTQLELKHNKDKLQNINKWLEEEVNKRTEELETANNKLLHLDKAKTEFLNIINHEIRTPLIGIKGAIGIIQYMDCPKDVKEMLEILDESSNRLEDFSFKALDITNINTKGKNALEKQLCDIYESVSDCIYKNKEYGLSKNLTISLKKSSENTLINADRAYLDKCFDYIINNAIKFADSDTTVDINISDSNKQIIITFEDQGAKFPEGYDITKISPFETNTHIDHNPALSLFLCKLVIEAHEGNIQIGNTETGARIIVRLPKLEH